ncbi:lipase/esterase [Fusarium fujikuroi]|nr:lipase/esterase [Fusarium fujikuroi]
MTLKYDPEFQAVHDAFAKMFKLEPLSLDDIEGSARRREESMQAFIPKQVVHPDVEQASHPIDTSDGHTITVVSFVKRDSQSSPGPALLHFHGGGMIMGSAEGGAMILSALVMETSIPVFSVNYRLAPKFKGPIPAQDGYAALLWLQSRADEFNVDPARIALLGYSGGGGVAAGVGLIARDQDLQPPLAKQILIYPMLDDRNLVENESLKPLATWTWEENKVGWTGLLGSQAGKPDAPVSQYAAPARATNTANLPPTYLDTGDLDIFRDEVVTYAARLLAQNVPVELHVYPGVPHAFELIAPNIEVSKRAVENRRRAMTDF